MKSIIINNRNFSYADKLDELSLGEWQTLMLLKHNPDLLSPSAPETNFEIPKLRNSLNLKSNILRKTDPNDRNLLLKHWSHLIAQQSIERLNHPPSPQQPQLNPENTSLFQKQTLRNARNRSFPNRPLEKLSAQAFCDATDLFLENPVTHAHLISCILSQPQNSTYNETAILRQAQKLKRHALKYTLERFDELWNAHRVLRTYFPACYRKPLHESLPAQTDNSTPSRWNDILLWVANYLPSEIPHIAHTPCYEFMRMADSKIRMHKNTFSVQNPMNHV